MVLLIRQFSSSRSTSASRGPSWSCKSASSPPMFYLLESKKSSSSRVHPSPTRQLSIRAEQLKNSPATRIYKKEKFQTWLTPWCPPPFRGMGRLEQCQGLHCWFQVLKEEPRCSQPIVNAETGCLFVVVLKRKERKERKGQTNDIICCSFYLIHDFSISNNITDDRSPQINKM